MENAQYITFDLYDTIVVRRSVSERHIFELTWALLSKRGVQLPDLDVYIQERVQAGLASAAIDAPTLKQILDFMPESYASYLQAIELAESETEMQQLSAAPGAKNFISGLRKKHKKIAFISDMHISESFLQPKIESLGLYEPGDILLVSSDVGFSKARDGKLFRYFLDTHNLSAKEVTHIGNSEWSDVKMARKQGLSAQYIPEFNLNRYESVMVKHDGNAKAINELVDASKLTRLNACEKNAVCVYDNTHTDRKTISDIASSVAAPVLYFFVLWVFEKCRRESITTVRFLTRDGEILKSIADNLPQELSQGLDIQLLEVSRNSLVLPAASVIPIGEWVQAGVQPGSYLVQHFDRLPAQHLFQRAGLNLQDHAELLSRFGLTEGESPLLDEGLEKWKQALESPEVQEAILEASGKKLSSVTGYLQQNFGQTHSNKVALVDVGWTGQQAAMLDALIQQSIGAVPLHLLIGRLNRPSLLNSANIDGWLFDESKNRPSPVPNAVAIFESFLATTSGGVDSYEKNTDGVWIAKRRAQQHTQALEQWGQPSVKDCLIEFANNAPKTHLEPDDQLRLGTSLLTEFWCHPTHAEATYWGDFPYEQDQSGKNIAKLVKQYDVQTVLRRIKGERQEVDWKEGSLAVTASPLRQIITFFEYLKSALKPNSV